MTPCSYTGSIPDELHGGQFVRNGSNPVANEDIGRDAHWFDGDGMLCGVSFSRNPLDDTIRPEYVNQYVLTDVFLNTTTTPPMRKSPLPSITTLSNPFASLLTICLSIFRSMFLVLLSHLPGSEQAIKRISVANTAVLYHDGRALATCESGPPMRVQLPSLETIGWFNGKKAEGEPQEEDESPPLGGSGPFAFMREWITAHPKVDPETNEMLLFNSTFVPPYVHYSIIPAEKRQDQNTSASLRRLNLPIPGISSAKMMHDFGVSHDHTIIMDLPLALDPTNLTKNQPSIVYDPGKTSRFGVFPRRDPSSVRWFETEACCIFHTANAWDVYDYNSTKLQSVDFLVCRMTSANVVYAGGNIAPPTPNRNNIRKVAKTRLRSMVTDPDKFDPALYEKSPLLENPLPNAEQLENDAHSSDEDDDEIDDEHQDRLYYYSFDMTSPKMENKITHQFSLSVIPFDFPSVRPSNSMSEARFIFGCSSTRHQFDSSLGRAAKMDCIIKIDAQELIRRGKANPPRPVSGCVDDRSLEDILLVQRDREHRGDLDGLAKEAIQVFQAPPHTYAQEPRFVPRNTASSEDDGYLVTYMFDEKAHLDPVTGGPLPSAHSELWVIDARNMRDVVAKVSLPTRVPYGFHAGWFSDGDVSSQRDVEEFRQHKSREHGGPLRKRIGRKAIDWALWGIGG